MVSETSSNIHPFTVLINFVYHGQYSEKSQTLTTSMSTATKRGPYKCKYCGEPKKNHICKVNPHNIEDLSLLHS